VPEASEDPSIKALRAEYERTMSKWAEEADANAPKKPASEFSPSGTSKALKPDSEGNFLSGSNLDRKTRTRVLERSASTFGTQMKRQREGWQVQKAALEAKFGKQSWAPRKKLSPDALDGIRALHAQFPNKYTTPVLADQFEVSPEAIRRILKGKWQPDEDTRMDRMERWERRGEKIWTGLAEQGMRPPKKWREMGHWRRVREAKGEAKEAENANRSAEGSQGRRPGRSWDTNMEARRQGLESEPEWEDEPLAERIL
jgi:Neugrin